jgi:hypothetical protein
VLGESSRPLLRLRQLLPTLTAHSAKKLSEKDFSCWKAVQLGAASVWWEWCFSVELWKGIDIPLHPMSMIASVHHLPGSKRKTPVSVQEEQQEVPYPAVDDPLALAIDGEITREMQTIKEGTHASLVFSLESLQRANERKVEAADRHRKMQIKNINALYEYEVEDAAALFKVLSALCLMPYMPLCLYACMPVCLTSYAYHFWFLISVAFLIYICSPTAESLLRAAERPYSGADEREEEAPAPD